MPLSLYRLHPWSDENSLASYGLPSPSLLDRNPLDIPVTVSGTDLTPFYIQDVLERTLVENMSPMDRYLSMGYPRLLLSSSSQDMLRVLDGSEEISNEGIITETISTTTTTTTMSITTTTTTTVAIDFTAGSQLAALNVECAYQCTYDCAHKIPEPIAQQSEVSISMNCLGKRKRSCSLASSLTNIRAVKHREDGSDSWSVIADYGLLDDGLQCAEPQERVSNSQTFTKEDL